MTRAITHEMHPLALGTKIQALEHIAMSIHSEDDLPIGWIGEVQHIDKKSDGWIYLVEGPGTDEGDNLISLSAFLTENGELSKPEHFQLVDD